MLISERINQKRLVEALINLEDSEMMADQEIGKEVIQESPRAVETSSDLWFRSHCFFSQIYYDQGNDPSPSTFSLANKHY